MYSELDSPIDIEAGKKIYIYCHQLNKSGEIEAVTPNMIQEDGSALKDTDRAYVYYVIFTDSSEEQ